MALTVRERGETVATLRYVHVRLMETLAAWVPTTPEMEAKLLFGSNVHDLAQQADALGKRTYELRMPLQHSLLPCEPYQGLLGEVARLGDTAERIACFYDAVLVALAERYRSYLARTDSLLDAPTVRILEHLGAEQARMRRESKELLDQLPALALKAPGLVEGWLARERAIEDLVVVGPERAGVGA